MSKTPQRSTNVVTSRKQRDALASPLRLEMIGFFEQGRGLSVRDIADRLGRPVASMYFHVHKLVDAGLLVESSSRGSGVEAEVVYRAVADRIALQLNPRSRSDVDAIVQSIRAVLRQVGREFEAACRLPKLFASMTREVVGRRQRVWLSEKDAADARRRLDALELFLARKHQKSGGTEYTWTSLIIPVASRHRTTGGTTRGKKK